MLNFVLFLLAVVLIIVIVKVLPGKAFKTIGLIALAVVVLGAGAYGVMQWQQQERQQAEDAKLLKFAEDAAAYARFMKTDINQLLADPTVPEQDKNYMRSHMDKVKELTYMPYFMKYASNLRSARGLGQSIYGNTDDSNETKQAVHLTNSVEGVNDVVILSWDGLLTTYEAKKLAEMGFKGGVFMVIYNLDGSRYYSTRKNQWIDSDDLAKSHYDNARSY
ncbi:TPA: hypothetical protein ACXPQL_004122 [Salmonella enterica]